MLAARMSPMLRRLGGIGSEVAQRFAARGWSVARAAPQSRRPAGETQTARAAMQGQCCSRYRFTRLA
jgi:NAD(P)-dependent dehydrogenase (short-subunit alcohol dehydrogenase family)